MSEDWADVYAAMDSREDDEDRVSAAARILDARTAPVPNLAYVQSLERLIKQQAKAIDKLERTQNRILAALTNHRIVVSNSRRDIDGLKDEMDYKLDRRGD